MDRLSLQYTKAAFTTAIANLIHHVQNKLIYIKYHLDSVLWMPAESPFNSRQMYLLCMYRLTSSFGEHNRKYGHSFSEHTFLKPSVADNVHATCAEFWLG